MTFVKIKRLTLQNFKGIARIDKEFDGHYQIIQAKNGAGKTTLMYSWQWVLGLDVPDVIPRLDNKELHNLETVVTAYVYIDGYDYKLCRTQTEEWKTNRETGIEEKHTNISSYTIDGVDFALKDYKVKLSQILSVPFDKLEMLTNKDYFNTDKPPKWTWSSRRKELFDISHAGELLKNLSDKDDYKIIAADLKKGFSTAEIRKTKANALKGCTAAKEKNETLLADKQNDIAKYGCYDFIALKTLKDELEAQITALQLTNIKGEETALKAQLKAQISNLISERVQLVISDGNKKAAMQNEIDKIVNEQKRIETYANNLKSQKANAAILEKTMTEKRTAKWNGDTVCPTCGQPLQSEKVEASKAAFASSAKLGIEQAEKALADALSLNKAIDSELKDLRDKYSDLSSERGIKEAELDNFEANARILELMEKEKQLNDRLAEETPKANETAKNDVIKELQQRLSETQGKLAYKQIVADLKTRVEQLKAENRELSDQEMIHRAAIKALDAYVAEQVSLITESINNVFCDGITWALFTEQYAGAESELKETCVCMLNEKVYSSLSTGERFRANLAVTKTLQKAYSVCLPLFCDNAECFTGSISAEQQIISLCAVQDKELGCTQVQTLRDTEQSKRFF